MQRQQLYPHPRVAGAFSRGLSGAHDLAQVPTISAAALVGPTAGNTARTTRKAAQNEKITTNTKKLQDLSAKETSSLISNVTKISLSESECYFDGRLLALLESWQEILELDIGLPMAKAKLLFLKISEFRTAGGVPTALLALRNTAEFTSKSMAAAVSSSASSQKQRIRTNVKGTQMKERVSVVSSNISAVTASTQAALMKTAVFRASEALADALRNARERQKVDEKLSRGELPFFRMGRTTLTSPKERVRDQQTNVTHNNVTTVAATDIKTKDISPGRSKAMSMVLFDPRSPKERSASAPSSSQIVGHLRSRRKSFIDVNIERAASPRSRRLSKASNVEICLLPSGKITNVEAVGHVISYDRSLSPQTKAKRLSYTSPLVEQQQQEAVADCSTHEHPDNKLYDTLTENSSLHKAAASLSSHSMTLSLTSPQSHVSSPSSPSSRSRVKSFIDVNIERIASAKKSSFSSPSSSSGIILLPSGKVAVERRASYTIDYGRSLSSPTRPKRLSYQSPILSPAVHNEGEEDDDNAKTLHIGGPPYREDNSNNE